MLILRRLATGLVVSATGCVAAPAPSPSSASSAPETIDFTGTWRAERILGPRILGSLMIRRVDGRLVAEAGGLTGTGGLSGRRVKFEWPNGARFEGRTTDEKGPIRGHWFQAPSRFDGNVFATPITLRRIGDGWRGELRPLRDDVHFRLRLGSPAEGRSADLFNRERNLGVFQKLTRWTAERTKLSLWGSFRGRGPEQILLTGRFHPEEGILNLRYPYRGGGYEFRRVEASPAASPVAWPLQAPAELGDGWPVADPASVGIDVAPIAAMVTARILRERTSVHDLAVHAMLIARRGRLVVERYFRGYDRDRPHDSRSASKTVAAVLAAAASQAGLNVGWDTPVYATLEDRRPPRRADIRLRHLVNMSSGLDCDDRDPKSAANEDSLWETAKDGDFYRHTLAVRVVHPPGKHPAYCSASSHLAAGVVAAAAQRPLLELLDDLLMRPLGIHHYGVPMSPVGRPYLGGGFRFRPRDFLRFPQLMLNGGTWGSRRLVSETDVQTMLTPAVRVDERAYGYLWWTQTYPYRGRRVVAHYMAGNGGQIGMLVPDLELAIVFQAGNYSDRTMLDIQNRLIPEFILPAVQP